MQRNLNSWLIADGRLIAPMPIALAAWPVVGVPGGAAARSSGAAWPRIT